MEGILSEDITTIEQKRSPDFDWVSARHACTPEGAFATVRSLAEASVTKANELKLVTLAECRAEGEDQFTVSASYGRLGIDRVHFGLIADGILLRDNRGSERVLRVSTDLRCRCWISWDESLLEPWQVVRTALEPLLFPGR